VQQTFCLAAIFWAEAAAVNDEHHRMIPQHLRDFSTLRGIIIQFVEK
jgi:hypothetical protein